MWFRPATRAFAVAFDKPLQPDPALTPGNWAAGSGLATFWIGLLAQSRHARVTGTMQPNFVGPASGILEYTPPPFDVIGRNGVPVAAFSLPWSLP